MLPYPLSFDGRIRRTEYIISFVIVYLLSCTAGYAAGYITGIVMDANNGNPGLSSFLLLWDIPIAWFAFAQGAKRCHDIGKSGWWQLIPFYIFWLFFQKGQHGDNTYGKDPKIRKRSTRENPTPHLYENPQYTESNLNKENNAEKYYEMPEQVVQNNKESIGSKRRLSRKYLIAIIAIFYIVSFYSTRYVSDGLTIYTWSEYKSIVEFKGNSTMGIRDKYDMISSRNIHLFFIPFDDVFKNQIIIYNIFKVIMLAAWGIVIFIAINPLYTMVEKKIILFKDKTK